MTSSKEVAIKAGVSQSTVSRVLNDSSKVRPEVVEKVKWAIKELNYRPNSIARSLVKQTTNTIALISGSLHNQFYVETTAAIVCYAREQGYNVNVNFDFDSAKDHTTFYEDVMNEQVDGIILSSILYDDPIFDKLSQLGVRFVMLNRIHKQGEHYVEMDNYQAGQQAAEHLVNLGHRTIGWIGGSLQASTFFGRYQGFRDFLLEKKIPVYDEFFFENDTSKKEVTKALETMLAYRNRPSAIFAANDSIAFYIIDYLDSKGYSIPEDISLIGLDDVEWSGHSRIQLTTVRVKDRQSLGLTAVKVLMDLMLNDESKDKNQITLPTEIVIRKTTSQV
ncbi:LacI family DNA-binding transcriptional regulator [Bacillaceae bacterium IKA-2]|nr:LacI family DNA-binding transcriptional regulator [Bacillaceae bacterium IKA-2]